VQRIGILGGTFDPPHIGHLILAEYTLEALSLDRMLFVPVGDHPHKADRTRNGVHPRVAMLRLAVQDNDKFEVSTVDIDRPGPHYSADTVAIIQSQYPTASLYFVMGADNLRSLPTWTRVVEFYQSCRLAVMRREGEHVTADMHDHVLPGLSEKIDLIDPPLLSVWLSSTSVVERIRQGRSVRYLVPDAVLNYIREHRIYQP
jgi:nicotinate-nucleotide adenylyltransferase